MLASLVVGALWLCGCSPAPERVCERLMDLQGNAWHSPEERKAGLKYCVEKKTQEKRENPKRYACNANCVIDERHMNEIAECAKTCP